MDSSYTPNANTLSLELALQKRKKKAKRQQKAPSQNNILYCPKWFNQWHLLETMSLFIYRNSAAQGLETRPEHLSFLSYVGT